MATGGPGTPGSMSGTREGRGDRDDRCGNPHFMQGTSTWPAFSCQPPGRAHPCPEGKTAREEARGTLPGTRGKSVARIRFPLPQGTCLLEDCFGIQMAASQETSCVSAANSPWEGGGKGRGAGGLHWGQEEREGGRLLPVATCLPLGLLATCPPRSRACLPPSAQPGTASGLPGCS